MYPWLYLVFKEICKNLKTTEKKINKIIIEILKLVDKVYKNILNKSTDQEETKVFFNIIVSTTRSLTLKEMNVTLVLIYRNDSFYFRDLDLDRKFLKTTIRNLCNLFVYILDFRIQFFY